MKQTLQTLGLFASYAVVILGTLFWSGRTVEKTLYDKYIIYLEGAILPTEDQKASAEFYGQVLDFNNLGQSLTPAFGPNAFLITEKKKLFLRPVTSGHNSGPVLLVRVRNGFKQLHRELLRRYNNEAQQVEPGSAIDEIQAGKVSQIFSGTRGDQFVVSDPSNNRILFYRHRLRLFGSH